MECVQRKRVIRRFIWKRPENHYPSTNERTWLYTSHPTWEEDSDIDYVHWLPTCTKIDILQGQTALGSTTMEDYQPFDGLVHATHISAARSILRDNKNWGHQVPVNSVASAKSGIHPCLAAANCVWAAPNCSTGNHFGAVVFHLALWGTEVSMRRLWLCLQVAQHM